MKPDKTHPLHNKFCFLTHLLSILGRQLRLGDANKLKDSESNVHVHKCSSLALSLQSANTRLCSVSLMNKSLPLNALHLHSSNILSLFQRNLCQQLVQRGNCLLPSAVPFSVCYSTCLNVNEFEGKPKKRQRN